MKKQYIIIGVVILLIIILILANKPRKITGADAIPPAPGPAPATVNPTVPAGVDGNKNINKGTTFNAEVKLLQQQMNKVDPSLKLTEDGVFGAKTEAAMVKLTGSNSLPLATALAKLAEKKPEQILVDHVYEDCTSFFSLRQTPVYATLLSYPDDVLTKAYYYWASVYAGKTGKSFAKMIADEGSWLDPTFAKQQAQLATRFTNLKLA
jgi:hypothetical protein